MFSGALQRGIFEQPTKIDFFSSLDKDERESWSGSRTGSSQKGTPGKEKEMIKGIGHVGIAVKNMEETLASISKALNVPIPAVLDKPEWKIKGAVVQIGETAMEILEDYGGGPFARFVQERGNAIHHLCLVTDNIEEDIEVLKQRGVEMADEKPKIGVRGKRIAFTKPSILGGIPIELSEP